MRTLVIALGLLGCEHATTTAPDPAPPPGPKRIEIDAAPPPMPDAALTIAPPDVMAELTAILDPKIGGHYAPTKLASQKFPFHADWDPRHAWLLEVDQIGQQLTIKFGTVQPEDTTELLKRLAVDVYFTDVVPTSGDRQSDGSWVNTLELRVPAADPSTMRGWRGTKK